MAAARALAGLSPSATDKNAPLLPPIGESRKVALVVSEAVARQAMAEGVATMSNADSLLDQIRSYMWDAVYVPYEHVDG
jgi:malate dehydrogenase (oxaloacetate-decarboxylating)